MMAAYYNEIEPFAAHVLKQLIRDGIIADGDVDTRSIADVRPEDLVGYTQCHFFAGGGLWSVAARMAGWPDDRPLWTGSCPCQPFSVAGKGAGTDDPRHLWPHFHRLIRSCRPAVVMGEQVAGAAGYNWFDGVRSDLEGEGYASRAVDIPACAVNAPHIRQRLYWVATDVAHADMRKSQQPAGNGARPGETIGRRSHTKPARRGELVSSDVANAEGLGRRGRARDEDEGRREQPLADPCEGSGEVANTAGQRASKECGVGDERLNLRVGTGTASADNYESKAILHGEFTRSRVGASGVCDMADADDTGRQGRPVYAQRADEQSAWSRGVEWRRGADGKTRRVKSGVRLLVDGMPGRVGLLRIGGNAIVAPLAAEVIRAFMESDL